MDYERNLRWQDYYRRRLWARISIAAVVPAFLLLIKILRALRPGSIVLWIVCFGFVGSFLSPVFYWESWKCPDCGQRFVGLQFGAWGILARLWKLWLPSRCSTCRMPDSDRL